MSNNDSIEEETKRILAEVEPDAQSGSNDSKESKSEPNRTIKKTVEFEVDENGVEWETNTKETPDSDW